MNTIGSVITDCRDDNARSRQELQFTSLFGVQPTFVGVQSEAPDVEAAGILLDQLDILANQPTRAVVLVNVAPRGDAVKQKWGNGTPFCYFRVRNVLVVSTYAGHSLSLARASGLVTNVELLDTPTVTKAAVGWGEITNQQAEHINHSQFRSLHFLPLVAYWLAQGKPVPSKTIPIERGQNSRGIVWFVDNFGNAKTTLVAADINFKEGRVVTLADGQPATCYNRLADVPKDTTALIIGSSGYGQSRFVEVVVQWKDNGFHASDSATNRHDLKVGAPVLGKQTL